MHFDPSKKTYSFHVMQANGQAYLFDPSSFDILNLTAEEGASLSELESDGQYRFQLEHEPRAECFESDDYAPPYELNLVLTPRCNLSCSYCFAQNTYMAQSASNPERGRTVDFRILQPLLEHLLASESLKFIKFFGGEPLLEFPTIMSTYSAVKEYCSRHGHRLPDFGVVTNGLLLDKEKITFFRDAEFTVTVSVDVIGDEADISTLRHPKRRLAQRVDDHLRLACELGFPLSVQSTYTADHARKRISPVTLLEGFRAKGVRTVYIGPAFNELMSLTDEDMDWVVREYRRAAELSVRSLFSGDPVVSVYLLRVLSRLWKKTEGHFICGAGIDAFTLMPSGDIYPCYLLYRPDLRVANLGRSTPQEVLDRLRSSRKLYLERKKTNLKQCSGCWAHTVCASCFGPTFLRDGTLDSPDWPFCRTMRATTEGLLCSLVRVASEPEGFRALDARLMDVAPMLGKPVFRV